MKRKAKKRERDRKKEIQVILGKSQTDNERGGENEM